MKEGIVLRKKSKSNIPKVNHGSVFSRLRKTTTRYSKITLRSILLSKVFHKTFKISLITVLVGSLVYGLYAYVNTSFANDVIISKSEIVAKVARLVPLPEGEAESVVRVEDASVLKKQNIFFENAKEGDYIIMYPTMAIIYDLRNNAIVATKKMGN